MMKDTIFGSNFFITVSINLGDVQTVRYNEHVHVIAKILPVI
jgi:hypothetical protein